MRAAVGGTRWWQVRPTAGLPAEWICMKSDRKLATRHNKLKVREQPKDPLTPQFFQDIEGLPRTILFVHGGAYYWGSINTHRYLIWRMARKMRGKGICPFFQVAFLLTIHKHSRSAIDYHHSMGSLVRCTMF